MPADFLFWTRKRSGPAYTVDRHDRLVELKDLPMQSGGAPCPMVLASDSALVLAYLMAPECQEYVVIEFDAVAAHYFGMPNDETLNGHPLYKRGLRAYSAFENKHSSWVRSLERVNSVHPFHRPGMFSQHRHFIFSFHDTMFECIAKDLKVVAQFPDDANHNVFEELTKRVGKPQISRV
jgi:hypothetical protein